MPAYSPIFAHTVFSVMYMKRSRRNDSYLILCGILVWFLVDAERLRAAAVNALSLCGNAVIPALFPFLAVSTLLISLGFSDWLSPLLSGLMTPLFRLPGLAGSALILGLVGGYPIGASTAVHLYRNGQLTREEAERLLTFCNNSNPVFLISVLGNIFGDVRTGIWLWLIHLVSALLTGLLFREFGTSTARQRPVMDVVRQPVSFFSAFVSAVRSAASGMVSVCGFVVLFYVLATPLRTAGGQVSIILTGLMELFSLTPLLPPDRFGYIVASGCAGWGGLSVLFQTAAVLDDSDLRLMPCILGKAVQGLIAAGLAALMTGYVFS